MESDQRQVQTAGRRTETQIGDARWHILLLGWVLDDRYQDFGVGEDRAFALEFDPAALRPGGSPEAPAVHLGAGRYEVTGRVRYAGKDAWALDFGVIAFTDGTAPGWATQDSHVSGKLDLRINSMFDTTGLQHLLRGCSPVYSWRVDRIIVLPDEGSSDAADPTRGEEVRSTALGPPRTAVTRYLLICELLR